MTRTWQATALLLVLAAAPAVAVETASETLDRETIAAADTITPAPATVVPETFKLTVHAPARRGTLLPALYAGFAGLQAYDGVSTLQALNRGAVEANPMMKTIAGRPALLLAVKGGVTAGTIVMSERLWKTNHRAAAVSLMVISSSISSVVAYNNASVLRGLR